jgi:hypothetical protein
MAPGTCKRPIFRRSSKKGLLPGIFFRIDRPGAFRPDILVRPSNRHRQDCPCYKYESRKVLGRQVRRCRQPMPGMDLRQIGNSPFLSQRLC